LLKIYEHQSHQCFYCKGDLDEIGWHLDHLVPVSKGGTNDPANIVLACRRCNNAKNDSTAQEYLDWLAGVVARWPELYKKLA
jgi:5-methylcytosine-specific restriction endonuclease McrA